MTVLDEIVDYVGGALGVEGAGPDTPLAGETLDSLQVNELLAFVEERWRVQVPPERVTAATLATPRSLAALVGELRR